LPPATNRKSTADSLLQTLGILEAEAQSETQSEAQLDSSVQDLPKPQVKPTLTLPSDRTLNEWFGHIQSLKIEVFIVDSKSTHSCPYCESWKKAGLERKWLFDLANLIHIDPSKVIVEEVKCEWECLSLQSYVDLNGLVQEYNIESDPCADNYLYAIGLDIDYFPSIRIIIQSDRLKKKTLVVLWKDLKQNIYSERQTAKLNFIPDQPITVEFSTLKFNILRPLLRLLKYLDPERANIGLDPKKSLFFGQFHRVLE
jgi:hypothetical protein